MRLGLLTGGGDAPGLNAAIRAVVRSALDSDDVVIGVRNGWSGLLGEGELWPLGRLDVAGILQLGGTILGSSSRVNPLELPGGVGEVLESIVRHRLDALVVAGGDGSLRIAAGCSDQGLPVIGIPKTIDNDLSCTDYCIGFDSAVSRVAEALDRLHSTASSHHRVMVVETMGRDVGWLSVVGGIAGGADLVLIPEVPTGMDEVVAHLEARYLAGRDFSIVVVAEGVRLRGLVGADDPEILDPAGRPRLAWRGVGLRLAQMIENETGHETRATILGHTQRGGQPTAFDRLWATQLGAAAHRLARAGQFGRVAVASGGAISDAPLDEVFQQRTVPAEMYDLARLFF